MHVRSHYSHIRTCIYHTHLKQYLLSLRLWSASSSVEYLLDLSYATFEDSRLLIIITFLSIKSSKYVLVILLNKYGIIVITRDQGRCNAPRSHVTTSILYSIWGITCLSPTQKKSVFVPSSYNIWCTTSNKANNKCYYNKSMNRRRFMVRRIL